MEIKKLQSFKDLNVWQKSVDLTTLLYKITEKFPRAELYGLTNQMRRAAISISSNIAEGFKRSHKNEKLQFYNVAYGSVAELESQIEVSYSERLTRYTASHYKLRYLLEQYYKDLISLTTEVSKMTDSLIKSVHNLLNSKFYILFPFIFLHSIFYILFPGSTEAAVLYLMPQSQTVYQGDNFLVEVMLDSEGAQINATEIYLKFPKEKIEVVDLGNGGSVLSLWPQGPDFSNQKGEVYFTGGVPGGFKGSGKLVSITFNSLSTPLNIGPVQISFEENSKVLLNDGKGTSANLVFLEGNYEIVEKEEGLPVISCSSHPDQKKWFQSSTIHLHWDLVEGAEYSYQLSKDPLAEPDNVPDRPEGELKWVGDMEYANLEDGIYYFTLKQKLPGKDWSGTVRFRANIDTKPPEEFKPEIGRDSSVFAGKYFLSFAATDKTSGVDHYEILEEPNKQNVVWDFISKLQKKPKDLVVQWKTVESPYVLADQKLQSIIYVKAVDKAGNERVAEVLPPERPFPWTKLLIALVIIVVLATAVWRIIRNIKNQISKIKNTNQK